ncbi:division/cell wall cluster transcriptional repressor MraZ [Liquorilactobacillus capillatus]|uniref:Transcriptional regulator MraZ n=1 Tax=Liquorilactobacillus capillatus DSM 19910 TaxID=1423731 RepID=A0A0R1M196_9LACO|nr:division/cell wall cluster transcriptional repressor MraZ [Liquorilactobacillus capillatus]KRL01425.1 cell division protein mraz [Liquorilactobacillus capillatus DSM 19910]
MFMGEYRHTIDAKGRLIIPAKFREELGSDFVVTRGMDGCLFGYPQAEWATLQAKLQKLPLTKKDARAFVRFFYSAATECDFDKQGRITLPKSLRTHAVLTKKCVVVGVSNRFEIWAEDRWDEFSKEVEVDFDDIAENMIDFGL